MRDAWNLDELVEMIERTTACYRKGAMVQMDVAGVLAVATIDAYPQPPADTEEFLVDVHFLIVGVDLPLAAQWRDSLVSRLSAWPEPGRLEAGPSFIEVGSVLESQEHALRLMALGEALGLWRVITPGGVGIEGLDADRLAGAGFVLTTGLRPRA